MSDIRTQKTQKYTYTNKPNGAIVKGGILGKVIGNINNINISKNGNITINKRGAY